jgi:hypothetical protein
MFINFSCGEEYHTLHNSKLCILFGGCSVVEAMAWGLPCTDSVTKIHCQFKSKHSVGQFIEMEIEATPVGVVYRPVISAPERVIREVQDLKLRLSYTVRHCFNKNKEK